VGDALGRVRGCWSGCSRPTGREHKAAPAGVPKHEPRNAAEVYGRLAGALLGSALTAELQGRLIEQLQWALDHRILIEQAKGVLMGREGISADVAYQRMRSAARSSRRPVAEVAQIVVDGGPWGLPRKGS
jgi:ANTAR domain